MDKTPMIYTLASLSKATDGTCSAYTKDGWVPARPIGFRSWRYRCRAAWLVWTGQADALIWPGGQ